jgi:hypothetical protein
LKRYRLAVLAASAAVLFAILPGRNASAAPEVHNFNLMLSVNPTSINGGGLSDLIDQYNDQVLEPNGFKSLDRITLGWLFQAELRYLVRPNVAVNFGVGQMKSQQKREFLPLINQSVNVRFEALTVPVHLGADYYFTPYTQGDFQARFYTGAGILSNVYNIVTLQQEQVTPQTGPILPDGSFTARGTADLVDTQTGEPVMDLNGDPLNVDLSGVGVKLSLGIGL